MFSFFSPILKNFNPVTTTGSKDKSIFKTPSIVTHYFVFFISLSAKYVRTYVGRIQQRLFSLGQKCHF